MKENILVNGPPQHHEKIPLRTFEQLHPSEKALAFGCIARQEMNLTLIADLAHITVDDIRPEDKIVIDQINQKLFAIDDAQACINEYHKDHSKQNEHERIAKYQQAHAELSRLTQELTEQQQKLITALNVDIASVNGAMAIELLKGHEDDV